MVKKLTLLQQLWKDMDEQPNFQNYVPPSWDVWFMKQVYLAAEKSKDPSTKIGAILVKDKHVISSGYNGFPIGVRDKKGRYAKREMKYEFVVHAEDNAVLSAARFGISTFGTILYTQSVPCNECTKSIIQGGITEIVIHSKWPIMSHSKWIESEKISKVMLKEAGVKIKYVNSVLGVCAYVNGKKFLV